MILKSEVNRGEIKWGKRERRERKEWTKELGDGDRVEEEGGNGERKKEENEGKRKGIEGGAEATGELAR